MADKKTVEKAKKRVKEKKNFYRHLNAFCFVTFILFVVNYLTIPGTWLFILPIIGWAVAVIGHYLNVFGIPSFKSEKWEENQFNAEMDKLEKEEYLNSEEASNVVTPDENLELKDIIKLDENYDEKDFV